MTRIDDLLLSNNDEVVRNTKCLLANVDARIYKIVDKILKQVVCSEIENLKDPHGSLALNKMTPVSLLHLKHLYELIDEYEEVEKINFQLSIRNGQFN